MSSERPSEKWRMQAINKCLSVPEGPIVLIWLCFMHHRGCQGDFSVRFVALTNRDKFFTFKADRFYRFHFLFTLHTKWWRFQNSNLHALYIMLPFSQKWFTWRISVNPSTFNYRYLFPPMRPRILGQKTPATYENLPNFYSGFVWNVSFFYNQCHLNEVLWTDRCFLRFKHNHQGIIHQTALVSALQSRQTDFQFGSDKLYVPLWSPPQVLQMTLVFSFHFAFGFTRPPQYLFTHCSRTTQNSKQSSHEPLLRNNNSTLIAAPPHTSRRQKKRVDPFVASQITTANAWVEWPMQWWLLLWQVKFRHLLFAWSCLNFSIILPQVTRSENQKIKF